MALERWPREGVPAQPRAWIVSTARHKALDRLRRAATFERKRRTLAAEPELVPPAELETEPAIADDRLRLIFTCCHPALAPEAQVALALRTLCGLGSAEIARAFLVPLATVQQRLVRAKAKIRTARIPYCVPEPGELPARLEAVLHTIYLIFNEGHATTGGAAPVRVELCREAVRLARLVDALLPARAEVVGLLALLLLHGARSATRFDDRGDLVRLAEQERARWDAAAIREGLALVERALGLARPPGPFALEAAIAGVHARAAGAEQTDWREIAALYDLLAVVAPSPVVALNRAVARAEAFGPAVGLADLDALAAAGELGRYHLLPAARGELLARLGRRAEAAAALGAALELAGQESERRFLRRRIAELERA